MGGGGGGEESVTVLFCMWRETANAFRKILNMKKDTCTISM